MHAAKTSELPAQPITLDVLREKYLKQSEMNEQELFRRVAKALASAEPENQREFWESKFLANMQRGAIGAGRIMSSAGTSIQATLINCFVQPVGDCIQGTDEDGFPGIYEALRDAAETMRRGGGVGYDFSRIRPRGAHVKGTSSMASGPCSYIDVFDHSCATVESAGARRGAQMGVLRIDHPDVLEFITAKRKPGRWNNFNVSVAVTDEFMAAVRDDTRWDLIHKAKPGLALLAKGASLRADGNWVYGSVNAREMWDTIMKSAYDFAEPGILFIDTINRDNNLNYCEVINATNPCGEQPLPSYGCCDLGPIILTRFVSNPFGFGGLPTFDYEAFREAVTIQVRALDNVLDITFWPLTAQKEQAQSKRRIGVGFTGLGNTLAMLQARYDTEEGREHARKIAEAMRDAAYEASVELAKEKGPFPSFNAAAYLKEGTFASRLPKSLKNKIKQHGIRNSHLLSIAPTGTVSLAFADNASNGIEPPFSWFYTRKKRDADGSGTTTEYQVEDHSWRLYKSLGGDVTKLPDYFVSALEMNVDGHMQMMAAVQPYVDTSISKTVNIPVDYPYADFKGLYLKAWEYKLKGLATYRPNDTLGSVLEAPGTTVAPPVDHARSVIEKRPQGTLAAAVDKIEYWTTQGRQRLYLVVSFMKMPDGRERAVEFFMPVGQNGGESQQWITSSMRLLSLAARGGFLDRTLEDMRKVVWDQGPVRLGTYPKADGTNVPLYHDSEVGAIAYAIQRIIKERNEAWKPDPEQSVPQQQRPEPTGAANLTSTVLAGSKCSECGAHAVIRKDGCNWCTNCGNTGSCG
jgi:ribonucleoside-diphosphate reductase alpha chain